MTRVSIPRSLRLGFIWAAALTLLLGFRFEIDYRSRLSDLPTIVDEHGITASLEIAMAGLDLYEEAKQIRKFGFASLSVGAFLCACAAITKSQRGRPDVVA